MAIVDIVGWIATVITVVYTCLGLPVQIHKNYTNKSTAGISLFLMVMLFLTFSSWVVYGLVQSPQNWFIIGSNFPGSVCVVIILCQFWAYRIRRNAA